jgi:hypothetical protein
MIPQPGAAPFPREATAPAYDRRRQRKRSASRRAPAHWPCPRHLTETTARPFLPHPRHRSRAFKSSTLGRGPQTGSQQSPRRHGRCPSGHPTKREDTRPRGSDRQLATLGLDIGPLLAGLGVLGIAIGFGAQSLVRDVISGCGEPRTSGSVMGSRPGVRGQAYAPLIKNPRRT